MIRNEALFRSTVIVGALLAFFAAVMSVWLNSLQVVPTPNPILSMKWIHNTDRSISSKPSLNWRDHSISIGSVDSNTSVEHLWKSMDQQILIADIVLAKISSEPVNLQYIEFFAGQEFGLYQYAAYRLLQQNDMFRLSQRDYDAEMAYLFPELPINIRSAKRC